jgi:protein transport protein SEC61 subunit gamma and related proteins
MDLRRFWQSSVRVMKITRKPDRVEFSELVKITGLGILAVGVIGFIVQSIYLLIT